MKNGILFLNLKNFSKINIHVCIININICVMATLRVCELWKKYVFLPTNVPKVAS